MAFMSTDHIDPNVGAEIFTLRPEVLNRETLRDRP